MRRPGSASCVRAARSSWAASSADTFRSSSAAWALIRSQSTGRAASESARTAATRPAAGAHPGHTRTSLQTAGASLGRDKPKRSPLNSFTVLPSQLPEQGAEALLYAAADPGSVPGGYHGPGGRLGLVGPTAPARITRRAPSRTSTDPSRSR